MVTDGSIVKICLPVKWTSVPIFFESAGICIKRTRRADWNTVWRLLTASGEDWCGDSRGRGLVCLGPALKLTKHPLRAILTVAVSPVIIEAYDTPL